MKVGERGQVTIPRALRDQYGIEQGVGIEFIADRWGIRIQKVSGAQHPVDNLRGVLRLRHADTVDDYIREIRGK